MSDGEPWFERFHDCLAGEPRELSPEQWADRIHDALVIAEAEKYATPKTSFTFRFPGATDDDFAKVRERLSATENELVKLER